jgi:hypothetical protein
VRTRATKIARGIFLFGFLCGGRTEVLASVITDIARIEGAGTLFLEGLDTTTPNNDNRSATEFNFNVVDINKDFGRLGPIDIVFNVLNSGGTTEYFFLEGAQNNTGVEWAGFQLELGFRTGDEFTRIGPVASLDFDTPHKDPEPFVTFFNMVNHGPDVIQASDGIVPLGFVPILGFSIDVPDDLDQIHPDGVSQFTLRQFPMAVPEPNTLMLLAIGGLTVLRLPVRRRSVAGGRRRE